MSAETERQFWAAFSYNCGMDRWMLAPGFDPMGVLVVCKAKIFADRASVAALMGATVSDEAKRRARREEIITLLAALVDEALTQADEGYAVDVKREYETLAEYLLANVNGETETG